jgi:hypothetical protein
VAPVGTYGGLVDVSEQLIDWSVRGGEVDRMLAAELGAAWGGTLEAAVWSGSGSSGQLKGLFSWSGTNQVNASSASFGAVYGAFWSAGAVHHATFGTPATVLGMHPRRWASLGAGTTTPIDFGISPVLSAGCPTTSGAGGTNDVAVYLDAPSVVLFTSGPTFRVVNDWSGSSSMTSRVMTHGYGALAVRNPAGVTSLQGTLSTPTFA